MRVCVVGLGYIGFPTACVISRAGHDVLGVDVNCDIVEKLSNGGVHIVNENGLAEVAREALLSGHLRVSLYPEPADVFILAVPTPYRRLRARTETGTVMKEVAVTIQDSVFPADASSRANLLAAVNHGSATLGTDLTYVEQAARDIAPYVRSGNLVVLESTVSPGTTNTLVRRVLESGSGLSSGADFYLAHAPERVLPGRILQELTENDRIVGGVDEQSTKHAIEFYRTFVCGNVIGTDATTAELVKLMENTFRDVNIALANEFALICEELSVDVFEAIDLANHHPRVKILKPGPGVGGHCIAVDPYFLIEAAPHRAKMISLARQINSSMPHHVVELVQHVAQRACEFGATVEKVAALGASYKPDVGDERESPALEIARILAANGYHVSMHDPYVDRFAQTPLTDVLSGADLLLMLTDHQIYRKVLTPNCVKNLMRWGSIVDTRGFFGREWDRAGFYVVRLGVGRKS